MASLRTEQEATNVAPGHTTSNKKLLGSFSIIFVSQSWPPRGASSSRAKAFRQPKKKHPPRAVRLQKGSPEWLWGQGPKGEKHSRHSRHRGLMKAAKPMVLALYSKALSLGRDEGLAKLQSHVHQVSSKRQRRRSSICKTIIHAPGLSHKHIHPSVSRPL